MIPVVSVLIFAYNHEDYIGMTIDSVISQKCSFDIEIIVSDDFSTDNTLSIINQRRRSFPHLIKIISNKENIGLNKTFENAVRSSKGEYIALLGGDDYWITEDKLAKQVEILQRNQTVSLVHSEYNCLFEETGKILMRKNRNWQFKTEYLSPKERLINVLCHEWSDYPLASSSCFRKSVLLLALDRHPEILNFDYSGEGTILHTSMSYYGGDYYLLPEPTTMYRVRPVSLSHYTCAENKINSLKKYLLLRLFVADSLSIEQKDKIYILSKGYTEIFRFMLKKGILYMFEYSIKDLPFYTEYRKEHDMLFLLSKTFFGRFLLKVYFFCERKNLLNIV